ncbi:MAG TPA: Bax inhibitor-1/YccA family protein [Gammaproteobacteria bacterium]
MASFDKVIAAPTGAALSTNKLIRNTYTLLSVTLLFSALMAGLSMLLRVPVGVSIFCSIGAIVLLWFVLPRFQNSAAGLGVVFAFTGLLGFGLGPIISLYLQLPKGPEIVTMAFGGTGVIFLGLSGYAMTSRKDFSFIGGFLGAGILVAFVAGIGAAIFGLSGLSLAVSAMFVLLMSGLILFETSRLVNGQETNYILATVSLYVAIYNLFTSLLHLLGAFSGED